MSLYFVLFAAGLLTILLPCILPLVPIVLGVSVAGRSPWRPPLTVAGMLTSFVGFTFLLLVVLEQFVEVADYMRIGTYYVLLLFGLGFFTSRRSLHVAGALLGSGFFEHKGLLVVSIVAILGIAAMEFGARIASYIQNLGQEIQGATRTTLGGESPITAVIIGRTRGLVWVPCAGPALGVAVTLVRDEPGLRAFLALSAYGLGTAIPLLLVGYGGQAAVHSVRALSRYSGHVKHISGVVLIATAVALNFHWFRSAEIWLIENTPFGNLGIDLEEQLFGDDPGSSLLQFPSDDSSSMTLPTFPILSRAPEFTGLGPWHNSEPLTLASLKGKVVLVDFWTYSCINCIRTLPHLRELWARYSDKPFVLLGVHSPEFVFEKSEANVADAIRRYELTYPIAQDNDFATWRAFANRYWPAKYLIDAEGRIRYTHFGEGAYTETDQAVRALLAEIGVDTDAASLGEAQAGGRNLSPELYLGFRGWNLLANGSSEETDAVTSYEISEELPLHHYALSGDWQVRDKERQVLIGEEGEIHLHFLGGEVNLVLGMTEDSPPASVHVEVDGEHVQSFTIDRQDMVQLWKGEYGEHDLVLKVSGSGVEAYAFTFG